MLSTHLTDEYEVVCKAREEGWGVYKTKVDMTKRMDAFLEAFFLCRRCYTSQIELKD